MTAYTTSRPDGGHTGTPFSQSIRDNFEAIRQAMVIGGLVPGTTSRITALTSATPGEFYYREQSAVVTAENDHHRPVTASDVVSHHQYMVVWRADETKARDQHQRRQQLQQLDRPCWQTTSLITTIRAARSCRSSPGAPYELPSPPLAASSRSRRLSQPAPSSARARSLARSAADQLF